LKGKGRNRRSPAAIGDILPEVMNRSGLAVLLEAGRVLAAWEKTVGPAVAGHTRPLSFHQGVLTVAVDSSAWLFQIERFQKEAIRKKLNRDLGGGPVAKIVFCAGEVKKAPARN